MAVELVDAPPPGTLLESPLWDGGRLHCIDAIGCRVHRHDFDSGRHEVIRTSTPVGFIVLDTHGRIIAGLADGAICRLDFGAAGEELIARPARDDPASLANDGRCDRAGRLWAGTKGSDRTAPDRACLSRLDAPPRLTQILHPVHISNGIGWSPDNRRMYYNDRTGRIWVLDHDLASGSATGRRVFVDLPQEAAVPDGMTVDSQGLLYCALWGGARIHVYRDRDGRGEPVEADSPAGLQRRLRRPGPADALHHHGGRAPEPRAAGEVSPLGEDALHAPGGARGPRAALRPARPVSARCAPGAACT